MFKKKVILCPILLIISLEYLQFPLFFEAKTEGWFQMIFFSFYLYHTITWLCKMLNSKHPLTAFVSDVFDRFINERYRKISKEHVVIKDQSSPIQGLTYLHKTQRLELS